MSKKIPTAEEFKKQFFNDESVTVLNKYFDKSFNKCLTEFAKLHVKAALEAASEKAKIIYREDGLDSVVKSKRIDVEYLNECSSKAFVKPDKKSILSAYPENLIQ